MLKLNQYNSKIEDFVKNEVHRFQTDIELPTSIGIYCCPWSGWISINFNISKTLKETHNNCPDFEYVEYGLLDLPRWQDEYEKDNPKFELDGIFKKYNHNLGDEKFNELIFEYLKPIIIALKQKYKCDFLLQMLDSNIAEIIRN